MPEGDLMGRYRIRTIKPEAWQDERVGDLSLGARLLWLGLITMADDDGRLRELPTLIAGHVFPYDDVPPGRLQKWLREVAESGMVTRYEVGGKRYIAFPTWTEHQRVDRPSPSDLPPPPDSPIDSSNSSTNETRMKDVSIVDPIDDRSIPPRVRASRSVPDPSVIRLSERLAACMRANDPKANADPHSKRWLNDMRLLIVDRGGDDAAVAEIERIIDWCQTDAFWRSNILSPAKLRKQFTQLLLKATPSTLRPSDSRRQRVIADQNDYLRYYPDGGEVA